MCFTKSSPLAGSGKIIGTFQLLCVFGACILHCACTENIDHQHSNSTTLNHIHSHPSTITLSPSSPPSSTSSPSPKSTPKHETEKKHHFPEQFSEQQRLHRFNQRFPSMRQCQLPSSGCECLWNVKHLRGMLHLNQKVENDSNDHHHDSYDHQHEHHLHGQKQSNYSGVGEGSTTAGEEEAAVLQRQMAVLMMSNVVRLGKETSANAQNDWFKCTAKANICQQQKQQQNLSSSYSINRVNLLSTLMPNMASTNEMKSVTQKESNDSRSEDDHHHHQDSEQELLSSIELFTDIESLLRQINHLLAIDQRDDQTKPKCFDREDLLDDYQQQIAFEAAATSTKTADDHHQHDQHKVTTSSLNLLYIEHLTNFIVNRIASGECIELFETKFLRDIISRYGSSSNTQSIDKKLNNNQTITTLAIHQDGFVKLLNDLHIGGLIENNNSTALPATTTAERRVDNDEIDHSTDHHDDQDDVAHHRHDHQRHRETILKQQPSTNSNFRGHRSISSQVPSTGSHNHIAHQHDHHHDQYHSHSPDTHPHHQQQQKRRSSCLDYHYYLHRQGVDKSRQPLTATDLRELSPIFIQQILSGACEQLEAPGEHNVLVPSTSATSKSQKGSKMDAADNNLSSSHEHISQKLGAASSEDVWKIYVYSSIAVAIISVSSICGVLIIPFIKSNYYTHMINLLIGLAFGSMAGDALFHLLPTVLGIHSHSSSSDDHNHDHDHQHEEKSPALDHMNLMIAILATIYALFLFEIVSHFFANKRGGGGHGHSHSHQQPSYQQSAKEQLDNVSYNSAATPTLTKIVNSNDNNDQATYSSSSTITSMLTNADQQPETMSVTRLAHQHSEEKLFPKNSSSNLQSKLSAAESQEMATTKHPQHSRQPTVIFGLSSLALIITIGDSIHNLLDGVAIGIAFSNSIASGISTAIAVLFHELPHEFGDFAVLLSTGLSVRRAAVVNLVAALTAFIGLYIGILLGANEEANRWALAICAGLFLYVALVDMLPELKEMPSTEHGSLAWVISLLVKNLGILTGVGSMVFLAKYEDLLKFAS